MNLQMITLKSITNIGTLQNLEKNFENITTFKTAQRFATSHPKPPLSPQALLARDPETGTFSIKNSVLMVTPRQWADVFRK